ncbi:MAG: HAMP domain-containing sensor histidine kinase [Methylotenera sp.]
MRKPKSLRELLLAHELIFIALILLAVAGGGYGIYLWDKSSKESQRIHSLVQEIQQTRGDLYRQMKELFDAFLLEDADAKNEYAAYTQSILKHFKQLDKLAVGTEEKQAIQDLENNYKSFESEAPALFLRYQKSPSHASRKSLYKDMETGIFSRYEAVSKRAEDLLTIKQNEMKSRLDDAKKASITILIIPILLAGLLLILSRLFLKRAIVNPIHAIMQATSEISAGNLQHKVPETGAAELATLSMEINKMADELQTNRDALVQSEKQAAMGLLVPMLAHNIRNPLASIRATAQLLDDPAHDKETRESLSGIMASVDRLERWTSGLLAYLLPIKPALTHANLEKILDGGLIALTQKLQEKHIKIVKKISSVQQKITTDEHLLEQVIYNLVLNAVDASPKNSTINIEAKLENNHLILIIRDEGSGMPFAPDPYALSPGPSTKRFGTGLGIPFAFKVCEVLSGKITFEASPPQGTCITLTLPQ